jgi:hypothetical protein
MATFKNPFKTQTEARPRRFNPKNTPTAQQTTRGPNNRVYFGSVKKTAITRIPFKDRKNNSENISNFVPKPTITNLLKRWGYGFTLENIQKKIEFIKSGAWVKIINLWFLNQLQFLRRLFFDRTTQLILIGGFISLIFGYSLYLTTFSTEFLVKNYRIQFSEGSYLSQTSVSNILKAITQKNTLGFIPDNHFWLINSQSLTADAKSVERSVKNIEVTGRYWPNTVDLLIETQPILATLNINSNYYLINQDGNVIGQDFGGYRQKVVIVTTPHKNVDSTELSKVFTQKLPDDPVENNQLNRLFFIDKALTKFEKSDIKIVRTEIKTLFEKDSDVFFILDNNTVLLVDSLDTSLSDTFSHLETVIQTTNVGKDLKEGKISYLDLRVKGRIYICYKGRECQNRVN